MQKIERMKWGSKEIVKQANNNNNNNNKPTNKPTNQQTNKPTNQPTNKQINKQTNKQQTTRRRTRPAHMNRLILLFNEGVLIIGATWGIATSIQSYDIWIEHPLKAKAKGRRENCSNTKSSPSAVTGPCSSCWKSMCFFSSRSCVQGITWHLW